MSGRIDHRTSLANLPHGLRESVPGRPIQFSMFENIGTNDCDYMRLVVNRRQRVYRRYPTRRWRDSVVSCPIRVQVLEFETDGGQDVGSFATGEVMQQHAPVIYFTNGKARRPVLMGGTPRNPSARPGGPDTMQTVEQ